MSKPRGCDRTQNRVAVTEHRTASRWHNTDVGDAHIVRGTHGMQEKNYGTP